MGKIESFEDILSWQKGRELVKEIYRVTSKSPFSKDFALREKIRKACISIVSNIAEGFERKTDGQFIYFLNVAKGSAAEVKSQLYLALDLKYIDKEEFDYLIDKISEISKLLYGLITYLQNQ